VICSSEVSAVDVFARGALVTRRVTLPAALPDGVVVLVLEGVTPWAEAGSFRAVLTLADGSDRAVRSVRSRVVLPAAGEVAGDDAVALEALDADIGRVSAEMASLADLCARLGAVTLTPRVSRKAPPTGGASVVARTAEALAVDAMIAELCATHDAQHAALQVRFDALQRQRDDLRLRQSQAHAEARRGAGHPTRRVEIELVGDGPVEGLSVTYAVAAARWWPQYLLRIEDQYKRARWSVEAQVLQRSGEDWGQVVLSLSTADLLVDARLPELPSLRLGRVQPPRKGFRAPPSGLDAMFAGYYKAFPAVQRAREEKRAHFRHRMAERLTSSRNEGGTRARDEDDAGGENALELERAADVSMAPQEAPPEVMRRRAGAPAMSRAAMAPQRSMAMPPPAAKSGSAFGAVLGAPFALAGAAMDALSAPGRSGGSLDDGEVEDAGPVEPPDAWLDYDVLELAGPGALQQGRLQRRAEPLLSLELSGVVHAVEAQEGPAGARDPRDSRGAFDHRYDVAGRVDVPGDGRLHRVSLGAEEAQPLVRLRTVPRAEAEVYREAELRNPFDAPLLAGPVEVFVDGSLLAVTEVDRIDRGGILRVGLGVERRMRVARNVRMTEETVGILGGETVLTHRVSIELTSALGTSMLVDVVDRVPVSDDKAVTVTVLPGRPEAEGYTQADRGQPSRGLRAWKVIVPAGGSSTIEYGYRVTLPSKNEIVGGNRRG